MSLPLNVATTTAEDIHQLVAARTSEGLYLDFKRELPRLDGSGRHELLADISAFANSTGGDVIFGIDEDGEGRASAVFPQAGNPDEEVRRLQDALMNGVEPRIPGLAVLAVSVEGGFVVIIRVPQSWAGPHRVKTNQHFFIRENGRKRQLDVPEIRGLFLRSEQQAERVRQFRLGRLGALVAGEAPHALVPGPLLVVHLVPTQAALGLVQVDPVAYADARDLPTLGTTVPCARLTLDGALAVRNPGPRGTHGYSLMFRNAYFEAVKVLQRYEGRPYAVLPGRGWEDELIRLVAAVRAELEHLGCSSEMSCMVSLAGADEVELGFDRFRYVVEDHQGSFDRKMVVLPDVLLRTGLAPDQALRPVFDLLWQSAGLLGSPHYDSAGVRTSR